MSTRQRNVLCGLLAEGRPGWYLLVRRGGQAAARSADAFLIGSGGVFGLVFSDTSPEELTKVWDRSALLFAGLDVGRNQNVFVPETVELVVVVAPYSRPRGDGRYRMVSELDYRTLFDSGHRLERGSAARIAEAVADRSIEYALLTLHRPTPTVPRETALIDTAEVYDQQREHALTKPFPTWMSFLDPAQQVLVARNYNGPARIAGPAGTGKTVVALHRMAYRARRTTGKLLFTTFVRSLPRCQQQAFAQLAPGVADRAEFKNLHSWAGELLGSRGLPGRMDLKSADNAFNRAWSRVASRGPLAEIESDNRYWREEVDRLIKGRGLTDFEEYARLVRRGRNGVLRRSARQAVWALYEEYERLREQSGFLDANDLISAALQQVQTEPLDEGYDMVVVDEVQDMTVMGLRLAHAIAKDVPNALLLVGDGQQQVYAGGWRLSDAGIPIVGRGAILEVNYRNHHEILELASSLEGKSVVDDLDGEAGITLSRSRTALRGGGIAETWRGADHEVERQLQWQLTKIRNHGIPLSATALVTRTNHEADRFRRALRRWNVPFRNLEDYDCAEEEMIKIGTVYRAKGLDFRAILHPYFTKSEIPEQLSDARRDREQLAVNQRFVAITRARDYVWLGIVEDQLISTKP
ncbi:UvrD-helicase domain-containing protein [Nocardia goodfellowii]